MLQGEAEDGACAGPSGCARALATRGFAEELRDFLLRAAERGLDGRGLASWAGARGRDDWDGGRPLSSTATPARFDLAPVPA